MRDYLEADGILCSQISWFCSNLEMNHIFGFRIFDIPKTLHSTLHQDSIQLIIMRLKSGLNPVGTGARTRLKYYNDGIAENG